VGLFRGIDGDQEVRGKQAARIAFSAIAPGSPIGAAIASNFLIIWGSSLCWKPTGKKQKKPSVSGHFHPQSMSV
jgi:hypothetical protein